MKFSIPKRYNGLRSIDFLAKILPQKFYQSNIVSDIALLIKQNALCATVSNTVTSKKAPSINDVISFSSHFDTPLSPPMSPRFLHTLPVFSPSFDLPYWIKRISEGALFVRGHSTTAWTEFCDFLTPLRGQFLYPERGQTQRFFDTFPPHFVHVVIE